MKLLGTATFGVTVIAASAFAAIYVVQDGDTLSKIAAKTLRGKIYGKDGGVEKLVALNPSIKNPNLIFPGDKINLSSESPKLAYSSPEADLTPVRLPAAETVGGVVEPTPPAPAPVNLKAKPVDASPDHEGHSLIDIQPRFFYSRINGVESSNGSTAVLLSKLNYGLNFSWRQLWTKAFESFVNLGLTKFAFTGSSSRTLEGASLVKSDLEVGSRLQISSSTTLLASIAAGQELMYRATTPTTVQIDSVMVPKLNIGITQSLYTQKPFSLGVEAKLSVLSGTKTDDYSVKTGWGYLGRIFIKQEPKHSNAALQTGLFYGQYFQNTSHVKLKRIDLGVDFRLSWSFGK